MALATDALDAMHEHAICKNYAFFGLYPEIIGEADPQGQARERG